VTRVLFLTRYPIEGASSRYRVFQYLNYLKEFGIKADVQSFMDTSMYHLTLTKGRTIAKILATLKAMAQRLWVLRHWRSYDAVYMQRELLPFGPPLIESWLQKQGATLLFDYDDALFIKKASRYNRIATVMRSEDKTRKLFRLVDCVVAGNNWLRDAAIEAGAAQAVTLEVAEDTSRIPMHTEHTNSAPVTIGWLGSPSTVKYLDLIAPVLLKIAKRFPEVKWEIIGGKNFQMEGVGWQLREWSLDAELEALSRFDIGLMPLPSEDWAKGKSGGKARTYMAAGVVPIVSAIGYNLELINHGKTGFLCETAENWENCLVQAIENASLRQRVAVAARAEVEQKFNLQMTSAKMADLLNNVVSNAKRKS